MITSRYADQEKVINVGSVQIAGISAKCIAAAVDDTGVEEWGDGLGGSRWESNDFLMSAAGQIMLSLFWQMEKNAFISRGSGHSALCEIEAATAVLITNMHADETLGRSRFIMKQALAPCFDAAMSRDRKSVV